MFFNFRPDRARQICHALEPTVGLLVTFTRYDAALDALRSSPGGEAACVLGEIRADPAGTVLITSAYGGSRVIDMLVGDPLPRIC